MTQLTQEVDSIIAEGNIDDSQSAHEEPKGDDNAVQGASADDNSNGSVSVDDKSSDTDKNDESGGDNAEADKSTSDEATSADGSDEDKSTDTDNKDGATDTDTKTQSAPQLEKSPTETVQEAQTFIQNLNLSEDKIFNKDGSVKEWEEVVPAGAFLGAQLTPVKVTDKDGKTHEFLLLADVEKLFPEGFEAKNNIEQMKFEKAIMSNEDKFDKAIETYKSAKEQYTKETSDIVQAQSDNQRINKEYRAMADQGLVPKVEGDPSDPKFLEQPAVKELNKILEWQEAKNKENSAKGLGQITSIYVAKQLMDIEGKASDKKGEADKIVKDRQEVASLSSSPAPAKESPKKVDRNIPMSRLADEIIASEGLR